jgi:hypothetical protein
MKIYLTEREKLPVAKTIEIGASCVFLDINNSVPEVPLAKISLGGSA